MGGIWRATVLACNFVFLQADITNNLLLMKTNLRLMVFIAVFLAAIVNVSAQGKKEKGYEDVFAHTEKINGVYIQKMWRTP